MNNIWHNPCRNCPSARKNQDPEAKMMKRLFDNGELKVHEAVFLCAWRPTKYCRGVCDFMGVDESDIEIPAKVCFKNLCETKKRLNSVKILKR